MPLSNQAGTSQLNLLCPVRTCHSSKDSASPAFVRYATVCELLLVYDVTSVMTGLVYKAYPNGCQRKYTFLPRLRPYPLRGHWLLYWSVTLLWGTQAKTVLSGRESCQALLLSSTEAYGHNVFQILTAAACFDAGRHR